MSLGNKLAAMYANKFTSGIIELDPQSSIANIVKGTIPDMGRPAITSGKLVISARTFCLNLPKIIGEVNRGNAEEFLKLFGVECAGFFNFSRGKILTSFNRLATLEKLTGVTSPREGFGITPQRMILSATTNRRADDEVNARNSNNRQIAEALDAFKNAVGDVARTHNMRLNGDDSLGVDKNRAPTKDQLSAAVKPMISSLISAIARRNAGTQDGPIKLDVREIDVSNVPTYGLTTKSSLRALCVITAIAVLREKGLLNKIEVIDLDGSFDDFSDDNNLPIDFCGCKKSLVISASKGTANALSFKVDQETLIEIKGEPEKLHEDAKIFKDVTTREKVTVQYNDDVAYTHAFRRAAFGLLPPPPEPTA